jgi:hypothetical protein
VADVRPIQVQRSLQDLRIELGILTARVAVASGLRPPDLDILDIAVHDGPISPTGLARRTGVPPRDDDGGTRAPGTRRLGGSPEEPDRRAIRHDRARTRPNRPHRPAVRRREPADGRHPGAADARRTGRHQRIPHRGDPRGPSGRGRPRPTPRVRVTGSTSTRPMRSATSSGVQRTGRQQTCWAESKPHALNEGLRQTAPRVGPQPSPAQPV